MTFSCPTSLELKLNDVQIYNQVLFQPTIKKITGFLCLSVFVFFLVVFFFILVEDSYICTKNESYFYKK